MEWVNITSLGQLAKIKEESQSKNIVIFKHSTSCYISKTVLRSFEESLDLGDKIDSYSFYFLDLIRHRDVSNKIAELFDVRHESPQLIVVKDGEAIHDRSHSSISAQELVPLGAS